MQPPESNMWFTALRTIYLSPYNSLGSWRNPPLKPTTLLSYILSPFCDLRTSWTIHLLPSNSLGSWRNPPLRPTSLLSYIPSPLRDLRTSWTIRLLPSNSLGSRRKPPLPPTSQPLSPSYDERISWAIHLSPPNSLFSGRDPPFWPTRQPTSPTCDWKERQTIYSVAVQRSWDHASTVSFRALRVTANSKCNSENHTVLDYTVLLSSVFLDPYFQNSTIHYNRISASVKSRAQKVCECRGGRPGLPVSNSPYSLCGRKATLNPNSCHCH